jgi:2-haloacid dehalogenase
MIKYILFDLDDTLLDFHASEKEALRQALKDNLDIDMTINMYNKYKDINEEYFNKFTQGIFDRSEMHKKRFEIFLDYLNITYDPVIINQSYMTNLANGAELFKDSINILTYLKNKDYKLYIATNGIKGIQINRLNKANILHYFDYIFVSSEIGYNKPSKLFFDYIFNYIKDFNTSSYCIIGDREESDILGGYNSNITTIKLGKIDNSKANYLINNLLEIKDIL